MKLFANIATWILHPIALTIPGVFLIVYSSTHSVTASLSWTFISLIFSGLVSLFVLYGVKKGFFNNIDVSNRKQRIILYPFGGGMVLFFALLVHLVKGPGVLTVACLLFILALIILDLINTKIKASVHVASVASIVTGTIYLYGGLSFFLLLLVPLVAWARIVEKKHTFQETVVGAICGMILTFVAINIVQFII